MTQTAVEWLAEKYNYVTWLRNRDEISAEQGDRLRKLYLEEAKEMQKKQLNDAYRQGYFVHFPSDVDFNNYYQETYENNEKTS